MPTGSHNPHAQQLPSGEPDANPSFGLPSTQRQVAKAVSRGSGRIECVNIALASKIRALASSLIARTNLQPAAKNTCVTPSVVDTQAAVPYLRGQSNKWIASKICWFGSRANGSLRRRGNCGQFRVATLKHGERKCGCTQSHNNRLAYRDHWLVEVLGVEVRPTGPLS